MKKYTSRDLDLDIEPNPVTGDLIVKEDLEAVKQSIKNIILFDLFEKPFRTDIPVAVNQFLFENSDDLVLDFLMNRIVKKIRKFEPRIKNLQVLLAKRDTNELSIDILYDYENKTKQVLNLSLERNR